MKNKPVTGEQLIEAIDKYCGELCDNPKISETKFHHMQTALYGCKMIIRNAYAIPQKQEMSMIK